MEPHETAVTVVGAGAAGIGVGAALAELDVDFRIVDRDAIGASFRNWPAETRFLTPSFPSNGFGLPDLNAIVPQTSPAVALDCQNPAGKEYAEYLSAIADHYELPVETGVEVTGINRRKKEFPETEQVAVDGGVEAVGDRRFRIETTAEPIESDFLVWAGGQFGSPRTDPFPGSENCLHTSAVESWAGHAASSHTDEFLIVGGFESGIDAAVNLIEQGCTVMVLDRGHPWVMRHPDPSETLSPYTLQRLDEVRESDRLTLVGGADVERVERRDDGNFDVVAAPTESDGTEQSDGAVDEQDGEGDSGFETITDGRFTVPTRPLLATGFDAGFGPAEALFNRSDGAVELTDSDESTTTPGAFLAGPAVEHDGQKFCFIYKFRARFPVVAATIAEQLGVDTDPLSVYEEANMYLDDLSCCEPIDCNC